MSRRVEGLQWMCVVAWSWLVSFSRAECAAKRLPSAILVSRVAGRLESADALLVFHAVFHPDFSRDLRVGVALRAKWNLPAGCARHNLRIRRGTIGVQVARRLDHRHYLSAC